MIQNIPAWIKTSENRLLSPRFSHILKIWVIYFLIYSFFGWMIDSTFHSVTSGTVQFGGFFKTIELPIPLAPIYGFGGMLCAFLAQKFRRAPLPILCLIIGMCLTLLEYAGGLFSTWIFGHRIWDYTREFLNLDGYIHFGNSICLSLIGTIMGKWVHPRIKNFLLR